MRTFISLILLLLTTSATAGRFQTQAPAEIQSVLKALAKRPGWNELLTKLEPSERAQVMGYTTASGAVAGALSGIDTRSIAGTSPRLSGGLDLYLPGGMETMYSAAAGAALGSLLGASHLVLIDSAVSDQLRSDPRNPYQFRAHTFQLVPRLKPTGATLALNASF
jgi:hypothetical protein